MAHSERARRRRPKTEDGARPARDLFAQAKSAIRASRAPAREPVVTTAELFSEIVAAAQPFRGGILFRALPDVLFFEQQARLRAPGSRLPAPGERLVSYLGRLGDAEVCVHHPLVTSFALWNAVRLQLHALFKKLGHPLLPVQSVAHVGRFHGPFPLQPESCASIVWVLEGSLETELGRHRVRTNAGETLWIPAHSNARRVAGHGLLLRVDLPSTQGSADELVWSVCSTLLSHQVPSSGPTPYAHLQPGRIPSPPNEFLARALATLCASEELEDALRIQWLRRVSNCGLEPMPAPRTDELREDTLLLLRPGSEILRMPLGAGEALWAVHGHVTSAHENTTARSALRALRRRRGVALSELLQLTGKKSERAKLRALLDTLWQVRAIRGAAEVQP